MRLTRRRFLRWALGGGAALSVGALGAACGQPLTTPQAGGAAPLAVTMTPEGTPDGTPGTPGTAGPTPNIPLTATAVARVPTKTDPPLPFPTGTIVYSTPTPLPPMPTIAQPQEVPTPRADDPYQYTVSSQRPRDMPTVLSASDLVVLGNVATIWPAQWSTDDGRRPANPRQPPPGILYSIFRPVELAVDQVIVGQTNLSMLILHAFGGQVGQDSMRYVSDQSFYEFSPGERAVVFLMAPRAPMPTQWRGQTLWILIEHYTVTADDQARASHRTLSLSRLLEEIAAVSR